MAKTLFLGLGNSILSDDAVGIKVVEKIRSIIGERNGIEFDTGNMNSFHLLDIIEGYDRVVIVDAIKRRGEAGTLYNIPLEQLDDTIHYSSIHTVNLATAIRFGEKMGENMPKKISLYGIEVEDIENFSEEMTEKVERAVPGIAREIIKRERIELN
jgi:hydrogenase maturation protease